MDAVFDKESEVICALVLTPNREALRLFDVMRPDFVFLAYRDRELYEALKGFDVYICTYLQGEVPRGAKAADPLKFLEVCAGALVITI
ncbi:MAG: hypothetical protein TU35_008975 [Thermoproteus sp. AZ2]|uniref:Uncharacterized protein n=1 Tax=Thermoproteus sp. AZ2 TaxID=1609232 RepID=A0ACC6V336_9CREN